MNASADYSSDEDLSVDDYKDTEIHCEELNLNGPFGKNVKREIRFFDEGSSKNTKRTTNHNHVLVRMDSKTGPGTGTATMVDDSASASSLENDGDESETSFGSDYSGSTIEDTIKIDTQVPRSRTTVESRGFEPDFPVNNSIERNIICHLAGMYKCTYKHGAWIKSEPEVSAANVGVLNFGDDVLVTEFVMTSIEEPGVKYAKLHGGGWVRLNKDAHRVMTHHSELSM